MFSSSTLARVTLAAITLSGAVVLTSCGGGGDFGFGKRFPVSGTVTYNGAPLEKGSINFIPDDPKGTGATGAIVNGAYSLSTSGDNDGALPGKYKVTVSAREDASAKAKADFEKARAARKNVSGTEELAVIPRDFVIKAESEAKSLIPAGYGNSQTTNLTAEVKEETNKLDFKLTDTDAPPEPKAAPKGRGRKR